MSDCETDQSRAGTAVFAVSTPLQILFALSIIQQHRLSGSSHLVVTGKFKNAEAICARLSRGELNIKFVSAEYFTSFSQALPWIRSMKPSCLFLDSDVGLQKFMSLLKLKAYLPRIMIEVYEEGVGTYRDDLYAGLKRKILSSIGAGTYFGGCALSNAVHVMDVARYRSMFPDVKASVVNISTSPSEILEHDMEEFCRVFGYVPPNRSTAASCNIYLSSWDADEALLRALANAEGDTFFKPHPHFRGVIDGYNFYEIDGGVPAEIAVMRLAQLYGEVRVYHHGSSTERYCYGDNIRFIKQ